MEFAFDDDQRALAAAVRTYLRDRFGLDRVHEQYDDPRADGLPADLWQAVGEQGWLAVTVPEEHGGVGLGVLDAAVIARAFGAAAVPGPWLSTVLLAEAVRLAGSAGQQADLLPRLAAGEVKGAVALTRPGSLDLPPATASGDALSGDLGLVEYASAADVLLVATPDSLHLVDPRGPGVQVTEHAALDRSTRLQTVVLDGAPGQRLAGGSGGDSGSDTSGAYADLLDRAAVLAANDLVGSARRALHDTVEYDKTRVQFGRPVGSFQAIKHDLADLHVGVTMAEHSAMYAAHALDVGADDRRLAASVAKAKASDAADAALSAMIQYHGGIGYTWEHHAHFFFKRAKRLQFAYGDAAQHRERISRLAVDPLRRAAGLSGVTPGGSADVQGTGVGAGVAAGAA